MGGAREDEGPPMNAGMTNREMGQLVYITTVPRLDFRVFERCWTVMSSSIAFGVASLYPWTYNTFSHS
jgi:hypothetical protein